MTDLSETITDVLASYVDHWNDYDVEPMIAMWDGDEPDPIYVAEEREPLHGWEAIKGYWRGADPETTDMLISRNDGPFKRALDRYKYPNRYSDEDLAPGTARAAGLEILHDLNARIEAQGGQLVRPTRSLADIAIFPFIRQFAHTDMDWFLAQDLPALQAWLDGHKQSALFTGVMAKYPQWAPGEDEPFLPAAA